jgi:tRNA/tmRNA/rRNA uracil-C5-methylase (TrmA/RlmC/RlmD family)
VACDPVALGRDAGLLAQVGYELVFLEAWDLFPHTHHMESIATFIRT